MNRENLRQRVIAGIAATALVPSFAFASGGGFDTSSITTKITEYGAAAVVVVTAMLLALWGIKALGLLKRG